jgi:hypothetical protein
MELGVRVNAGSEPEAEEDTPIEGMEWPSVNVHGMRQTPIMPKPATRSLPVPRRTSSVDLGPCLYFGPEGQRCDRRATKDGFCSRHQPGTPAISAPFFTPKKLAAFLIALAMFWPELAKFLSALARLLR